MQKADGMLIRVKFNAGSADQRQYEKCWRALAKEFTAIPTFNCGRYMAVYFKSSSTDKVVVLESSKTDVGFTHGRKI